MSLLDQRTLYEGCCFCDQQYLDLHESKPNPVEMTGLQMHKRLGSHHFGEVCEDFF